MKSLKQDWAVPLNMMIKKYLVGLRKYSVSLRTKLILWHFLNSR